MKKNLLIILTLINVLVLKAQNNGQYFENNLIRIDYLGYKHQAHTFKVNNKQTCAAIIRTRVDQEQSIDNYIDSVDFFYVNVFRETPVNVKFKAKAETICSSNPDMGWVEVETGLFVLNLNENENNTIKRLITPNKLDLNVINGVYYSFFKNTVYREHIVVYDIIGNIKYNRYYVNRNSNILDLNQYLSNGLNFISIMIDDNNNKKYIFKVVK